MPDALRAVLTATAIVLVLLTGVAVIDEAQFGEGGITDSVTRQAALLDGPGTVTVLGDGKGTDETVYKSTGYAVNLTGASDSYVESDQAFEIASSDTWTASVWGYVDDGSGSENMTALSLDGRVIVSYQGSESQWSAWYYEEGDRDSWVVNVSASGNEVGNLTNVMAWTNGTHLTIYRNGTQGEVKNITGSNIESAPVTSTNWDGRLEEVRTFDEALNASVRSEVVSSPVEQQPDVNRTARIMFDQPDRSTQVILFSDAKLTQSNVTFSPGFAAQEMDPKNAINDFNGDTDYVWDSSGPRVEATDGGELDGAPVAYASYDYDTTLSTLIGSWGRVASLAALIPILLIGAVIVARIKGA